MNILFCLRNTKNLQRFLSVAGVFWCLALSALAANAESRTEEEWVTAWSASPTELADRSSQFVGHTILQRVLVTASGKQARMRLSNVSERHSLVVSSMRLNEQSVTYAGERTATIPPGSFLCSDPINVMIEAGDKVNIRLFIPLQDVQPTIHWYGRESASISPPGDYSSVKPFPVAAESDFRVVVSAIDVLAFRYTVGIVAIGDSITDGSSSPVGTDMRWPDVAWRALTRQGFNVAMANAGIGGDRLLRDARHTGTSPGVIGRLNTDVLSLSKTQIMILAAGINDIAWPGAIMHGRELAPMDQMPTHADIIHGYKSVIARAHNTGLIVVGATITPYAGANATLENFHTPEKEAIRRSVNHWIRNAGAFDAVIDFDALLRDPADTARLLPKYDSGDHIHPSQSGFEAMGNMAAERIAPLLDSVLKAPMRPRAVRSRNESLTRCQ